MRYRVFLPLVSLLLVPACNVDELTDLFYPGREQYKVFSDVMGETLIYLCKPGDSEADTKARVAAAHQMFEAYVEEEAGKLTSSILEAEEFSYWDGLIAAWKMSSAAGDMVDRMDAELDCIPYEA